MKKLKEELKKIQSAIALQEKIINDLIQAMEPKKAKPAARKQKAKPVDRKRPAGKKKATDLSVLLKSMSSAKKGTGIDVLISKTGFARKKINNLIYLAITKKQVDRVERGVYKKS